MGDAIEFRVNRDGQVALIVVPLVPEGGMRQPRGGRVERAPRPTMPPQGMEPGSGAPGFLGVLFEPSDSGVRVTSVVPGSGAEAAGLQEGDILRSINNQPVQESEALPGIIQSFHAGDTVRIEYERSGSTTSVTATLGTRPTDLGGEVAPTPAPEQQEAPRAERQSRRAPAPDRAPQQPPQEKAPGYLGVETTDLSDDARQILGLEEGVGLVVASVVDGTAAQAAGLRAYDVIVAINGAPVGSREDFGSRIRESGAGSTLGLTVLRKGHETQIRATLGGR